MLVSHLHAQLPAARGDAQRLVAQLARQVEGLAHGLLQREPRGVLLHCGLERRTYLRRGAEVPVRGHQSLDALVRAAEVVAVDEESQPSHAVVEVSEDGAAQELVPQRLPEALHLPQRLRVVGAALDVVDVLPLQLGLELRLAAPRRVLPSVVRQHLARHTVRGDAALEGLHHQRGLLPVRDGMADDEAAVVVHEDGHVEPLMSAQEEGEDVRLPELVRLCALEACLGPRGLLHLRRSRLEQPLLMKNPAHGRLRHPDAFEASQQVRDALGAQLGTALLRAHHQGAPRVLDARRALRRPARLRSQRRLAADLKRGQPVVDRRRPDSEHPRHFQNGCLLSDDLLQHPQPELRRVARHPSLLLSLPSHPSLPSRLRVRHGRATVLSN